MSVRFTYIYILYIVIILTLFNGLEIVSCLIWNFFRFFLVFLSLDLTEPRLALNLPPALKTDLELWIL